MTYKNKYKCPEKIWRKLNWVGRTTYNEVYEIMTKDRKLIQPTTRSFRASLIADEDWKIVSHNAACVAAWAADDAVRKLAA